MELGITYFDQATLTVKIVMIILVIASIWSWTVILEKLIYFPFERRRIDKTVKKIFSTHEWDKRNDELIYKIQMKKDTRLIRRITPNFLYFIYKNLKFHITKIFNAK